MRFKECIALAAVVILFLLLITLGLLVLVLGLCEANFIKAFAGLIIIILSIGFIIYVLTNWRWENDTTRHR